MTWKIIKAVFGVSALFVLAGIGVYAWMLFTPESVASGWRYTVVADNLKSVSAIAFDGNKGMFATLELKHGKGKLVHITEKGVEDILSGMDKPDGLVRRGDTMFISNEYAWKPIISLEHGVTRLLTGTSFSEGIADAGDNQLVIVEDRRLDGRLLRMDTKTGGIDVLLTDLHEPEGVCQNKDGVIYYAEKAENHVMKYDHGKVSLLTDDLTKPAYLNCQDDGSILITEDRTSFGHLFKYKDGKLDIIMSHLQSPQTVIVDDDGALYLAEQRKNRILKIERTN